MCDSMKTPEERKAESFFGSKADAVHGLFFPPAPASNMALFRKRITQAIERQRVRKGEAEKKTAAERFRFLAPPDPELASSLLKDYRERRGLPAEDRARLRQQLREQLREHRKRRRVHRKDRPPDSRSVWNWETVTHPETGETRSGWIWEGMGLVIPLSVFRAETSEESPPCWYLELALIHDLTQENRERERKLPPRPKLLDGLDLPDEIVGEPHSSYIELIGDYCPGMNKLTDSRRSDIERALADVKADLAIEQGEQAGGSGSLLAQARKAAQAAPPTVGARDKVFISYSHKDKKFLDELLAHLKPLIRAERISIWSDKQIKPEAKWFDAIKLALASTKIAVLLVTKDFLASDFIHEHELGPLLKEAEQGRVKIHWVPVSACNYSETPLKDYQALVSPDKPLAAMKRPERDGAWVKICEAIKAAL